MRSHKERMDDIENHFENISLKEFRENLIKAGYDPDREKEGNSDKLDDILKLLKNKDNNYRGISTFEDKFVYGSLFQSEDGSCFIINTDEDGYQHQNSVIPETVGQKVYDLYEGDILQIKADRGSYKWFAKMVGVLVFEKGAFRIKNDKYSVVFDDRDAVVKVGDIYNNFGKLKDEFKGGK